MCVKLKKKLFIFPFLDLKKKIHRHHRQTHFRLCCFFFLFGFHILARRLGLFFILRICCNGLRRRRPSPPELIKEQIYAGRGSTVILGLFYSFFHSFCVFFLVLARASRSAALHIDFINKWSPSSSLAAFGWCGWWVGDLWGEGNWYWDLNDFD